MSPKFLTAGSLVFKIYSREESRMHIHIIDGNKNAKVWLEPQIELAENKGFKEFEINRILKIVEENECDFTEKWKQYFG